MFSGGTFNGSKLKSQLKMASSQFQISANKKTSLLKQNMKEIAMYLQEEPPKIEKAKLRTEAFIHDDNLAQALDILHCQCDLLIPRVKLIEYSKNGHQPPQDIVSCISTLIYATPYVDVKELSLISKQFRHKYGKEFEENALKNTNGVVNEKIVSLLSHQPDKETIQKYMIGICKHFDVRWEPTSIATALSSSPPPSQPPPSNPNYDPFSHPITPPPATDPPGVAATAIATIVDGSKNDEPKNTNSMKQNNHNTNNEEFDKYKYYDIQPEDIVVVAMPDQPNQPKNNNYDGKGNLPSSQQQQQQQQQKRESTIGVTDTGNMDVIAEAVFIGEQQQQLQPNQSTAMTTTMTKSDILNRPLKELRKSHYRNQQRKEQLVVEPPSPSVVDDNAKIESTKKMNMNKNHATTESHGNGDEKDITKEEIEDLNRQLPLPTSAPIQRKPKSSPPPPSDQGDDDNGDDLVVVDKKGSHHLALEGEKDDEEYMKSIKSNNNNKELEVTTTTTTKNFDDDFVADIRKLLPSPPSEDVSPESPRPTSTRTMSPKQQQKLPPQIPKSLFFRKAPLSEQSKEKRIMSELSQSKEEKLEVVKQQKQQQEEDVVVFMKNIAKEQHAIRKVNDEKNIIEEKKQIQLPHQQTQQASDNKSIDIKNINCTESRDEIPTKTSRETNIVPTLSLISPKSSSNNGDELIPPSTMEAQLPVVSAVSVAEMMNNNERNMEISTATTEEEEQLKMKQEKKKRNSMIVAAAGVVGGVAGLVAPVVTVGVVAGVSSALAAKKISKKMNKNKQHQQQTPPNKNSVGTMKFDNNATAIKLSS